MTRLDHSGHQRLYPPNLHHLQTRPAAEGEDSWLAALHDAQIDPHTALLWALDGHHSRGVERACTITRHFDVEVEDGWPELEPFLDELHQHGGIARVPDRRVRLRIHRRGSSRDPA